MKKIISVVLIIMIAMAITQKALALTGTVNVEELNLRESASTSSKVLGKLVSGTKLTILSTEGDWYKVNYNGKEGYVSKIYINEITDENTSNSNNLNNSENTESISSNNSTDSNGLIKGKNTNLTEDTTLYVLPLVNSTKLNLIKKDTEVLVVSVNGLWTYIHTDNESGWVMSSKLRPIKVASEEKNEESITENASENSKNTSETENTSQSSNTTNSSNAANETVNENTESNKTTNSEKNTSNENLTSSSSKEYPITMYVNVDAVNIRSKASTSSDKVTSIGKNVPVRVTGKEGEWYKVEVSDGKGYILSTYLSKQKQ